MLEDRLTPSSFFYDVTGTGDTAGSITGGTGTAADPFIATTLRAAITAAIRLHAGHRHHPVRREPDHRQRGDDHPVPRWATATAGPSDFGITTNITIAGPTGSNGITLNNSGSHRLFYVSTTGTLTLDNLTLSGGDAHGRHRRRR